MFACKWLRAPDLNLRLTIGEGALGIGEGARDELSGTYNSAKFQSTKGCVSRWGHHVVLIDV